MDDSGPAYPRAPFTYIDKSNGLDWDVREQSGLTKREAFTMAAMQGIIANPNFFGALFQQTPEAAAEFAVQAADATLAALREGGTP